MKLPEVSPTSYKDGKAPRLTQKDIADWPWIKIGDNKFAVYVVINDGRMGLPTLRQMPLTYQGSNINWSQSAIPNSEGVFPKNTRVFTGIVTLKSSAADNESKQEQMDTSLSD